MLISYIFHHFFFLSTFVFRWLYGFSKFSAVFGLHLHHNSNIEHRLLCTLENFIVVQTSNIYVHTYMNVWFGILIFHTSEVITIYSMVWCFGFFISLLAHLLCDRVSASNSILLANLLQNSLEHNLFCIRLLCVQCSTGQL